MQRVTSRQTKKPTDVRVLSLQVFNINMQPNPPTRSHDSVTTMVVGETSTPLVHHQSKLIANQWPVRTTCTVVIQHATCISNGITYKAHLHLQLATFVQPISDPFTLSRCSLAYSLQYILLLSHASTVWLLTLSRRCSSAGELGLLSALSQSFPSPPRRESSGRAAGYYQRQPFRFQMQLNQDIDKYGKVNYPLNKNFVFRLLIYAHFRGAGRRLVCSTVWLLWWSYGWRNVTRLHVHTLDMECACTTKSTARARKQVAVFFEHRGEDVKSC